MEAFLVRLAYTPAAWSDVIGNMPSLNGRLAPVRKLLRHFGAGHSESTAALPRVATGKFANWSRHEPLTVITPPDEAIAHALNMVVSAEAGPVQLVDLTSVVPMQDAVKGMVAARVDGAQTGQAAPGQAEP